MCYVGVSMSVWIYVRMDLGMCAYISVELDIFAQVYACVVGVYIRCGYVGMGICVVMLVQGSE